MMIPIPIRLVCLAAIELSFLTFPATPSSSAILQLVHLLILGASVLSSSTSETDIEPFLRAEGTVASKQQQQQQQQQRQKHHDQ
jgi:hypothetical protein